jgi:hypothetical protein
MSEVDRYKIYSSGMHTFIKLRIISLFQNLFRISTYLEEFTNVSKAPFLTV